MENEALESYVRKLQVYLHITAKRLNRTEETVKNLLIENKKLEQKLVEADGLLNAWDCDRQYRDVHG